jgi:hypothetical protein
MDVSAAREVYDLESLTLLRRAFTSHALILTTSDLSKEGIQKAALLARRCLNQSGEGSGSRAAPGLPLFGVLCDGTKGEVEIFRITQN